MKYFDNDNDYNVADISSNNLPKIKINVEDCNDYARGDKCDIYNSEEYHESNLNQPDQEVSKTSLESSSSLNQSNFLRKCHNSLNFKVTLGEVCNFPLTRPEEESEQLKKQQKDLLKWSQQQKSPQLKNKENQKQNYNIRERSLDTEASRFGATFLQLPYSSSFGGTGERIRRQTCIDYDNYKFLTPVYKQILDKRTKNGIDSQSVIMSALKFQFQSGVIRETITIDSSDASLMNLRVYAVNFINKHHPNHGLGDSLAEHILFYKHDLRSVNILQLLTTSEDITDGILIEIVLSTCPQHERLVVHPHTLYVHSYKTPTFCDFCGELLFGLVKQGLKCHGCGLNYHKRCASKIPNNCSGSRQRRPSAIPLSPRNSVGLQHTQSSLLATISNAGFRGSEVLPSNITRPSSTLIASVCPTAPPSSPTHNNANIRRASGAGSADGSPLNATISSGQFSGTIASAAQMTPDIFVTSDYPPFVRDDGDPIGGNFLQMPRKDRSSSWSGRPLWMEIAEATRVKVPHTFQVHSYKRPTVCQYCKKLLKGLIRQGIQCKDCKYNCHKKCAQYVAKDCSGRPLDDLFDDNNEDNGIASGFVGSAECGSFSSRSDYGSVRSTTATPTIDSNYDTISITPAKMVTATEKRFAKGAPSAPLHKSDSSDAAVGKRRDRNTRSPPIDDDSASVNESQNIPLMRIVMSKKQMKRPTNKVIREGWMVHYTDRHSMRKKHFWRLDTKSIVMYKDESSNGYYKELPLSEILEIRGADELPGNSQHAVATRELTHFFEIRTHTSTYFIAGVPTNASSARQRSAIENAAHWAAAIKQALMPVTPQTSQQSAIAKTIKSTDGNTDVAVAMAATDMAQLKVPYQGETGHLGLQIQSEQEFSQLYQIFADEILGSGQFGTVYGGIHRKSGKHVAVKLIDKLKFPSNKEAALRTEVEILQKVRHPGVVGFEQMLETKDRIFVVMEKMKGDMLEMILSSERGRLSERITQFLVHQILIALRYLHNMNIVHCDLKPENILLTSDSDFPQVKLCDFGFARIIGERSFRRSVVGTPAYLAPEVLRNKGFNRSLDMWSVGVIVYVSLSGTFPFNEDEDINDQIQNADFMYPPNPWKDISSNAIEFINSLLQVKMSKRLTVSKALSHIWLQSYDLWSDLRLLEKEVGERFVTHESDDARWHEHELANNITPAY